MDYGTLQVTTPDGQVREYPIDVGSVLIGRADSNRVVIDHVSVSRRHARLSIDGERVLIEDLSSATGTFVGGQRLPSETPRELPPGQPLRFGDVTARFNPATADAPAAYTPAAYTPSPQPATGATPPTPSQQRGPTEQAIVVSLVSPSAPMAAGATTTATCVVENRGSVADTLTIEVQNLPPGWARVTRPQLALSPGARDEVTIILQPPKTSEARAGEYSFAAAATSRAHGVEVRALGKLTILGFGGQSLDLKPTRSTGAFTVVVSNSGNVPAEVSLRGAESQGALAFAFTPESFELAPGESRPVRLQAKTAKGRFFGAERVFPFEVETQGSPAVSASGELRSRPPWLTIRWFVLGAFLIIAAGAGFFGYRQLTQDDGSSTPATATAVSGSSTPAATAGSTTPAIAGATKPATTTATTLTLKKGGNAIVINSADKPVRSCLQLRPAPARNATPFSDICNGTKVKLLDGTGQPGADGFTWWSVQTEAGVTGWSAQGDPTTGEQWLQAVQ